MSEDRQMQASALLEQLQALEGKLERHEVVPIDEALHVARKFAELWMEAHRRAWGMEQGQQLLPLENFQPQTNQ